MPYLYHTFVYDFDTLPDIKSTLDSSEFFNILYAFSSGYETKYTDQDNYTYYKYLDNNERQQYEINPDFEYKLNSDLFRDSHFSPLTSSNYNVLALGCSYTFGYGLPKELSWPSLLEGYLKESIPNIKMFNLGSPALSIDVIVKNLLVFISKYGVPDAIFALLPDMNRHVIYHPNEKRYVLHFPSLDNLKNKKDRHIFNKTKYYVFEDIMFYMINQIRMLELICKAFGIKLLWHSWKDDDSKIYKEMNFSNYINDIDNWYANNSAEYIKDIISPEYVKYYDNARDGDHPGLWYSVSTADLFFDRWKRYEELF